MSPNIHGRVWRSVLPMLGKVKAGLSGPIPVRQAFWRAGPGGLGRVSGCPKHRIFAKSVSFCFILFHSLAGELAGRGIRDVLMRTESATLGAKPSGNETGRAGRHAGVFVPIHPHPRIEYGAGSNLPPARGKGLLRGGVNLLSQAIVARMCGTFKRGVVG